MRLIQAPKINDLSNDDKNTVISQMALDAAYSDNADLLHALLGPRITAEELANERLFRHEIEEHEKRQSQEQIREHLFKEQLNAIKNYLRLTPINERTVEDMLAEISEKQAQCRAMFMDAYRTRTSTHLQVPVNDLDTNPQCVAILTEYERSLDTLLQNNSVKLDSLEQLPELLEAIKIKRDHAMIDCDQILSDLSHSKTRANERLNTLLAQFDKKREAHRTAKQYAFAYRDQWVLQDPTLKDITEAEFEALIQFNLAQPNDSKITAETCRSCEGNTLLHVAFRQRSQRVARMLLHDYKANPAATNFRGLTAHQYAELEELDHFLEVINDGHRRATPYLSALSTLMRDYASIIHMNPFFRIFYHHFWNVREKHQRRTEAYERINAAIEAATHTFHDEGVEDVYYHLKSQAHRPDKSRLFGGIQRIIDQMKAGTLEYAPRTITTDRPTDTPAMNQYMRQALEEQTTRLENVEAEQIEMTTLSRNEEARLHGIIERKDRDIEYYKETSVRQRHELDKKDDIIAEKNDVIATQGEQLAEKDETIAEKNVVIATQSEQLAEKDETISSQDTAIANLNGEIVQLRSGQEALRTAWEAERLDTKKQIGNLYAMIAKLNERRNTDGRQSPPAEEAQEEGRDSPKHGFFS